MARATYGPGDYERVRFALLIRIADGLNDAARERATVVFDAFDPPPDSASRFRFRELTVQFAVEVGEADSLIEDLIRKHSSPRQLRVVSDDVRLQKAAKRRGGSAVKCDAFLRRLDRFSTSGENPSGHRADHDDSPGETADDWLAYFGMTEEDAAKEVVRSGEIPGAESPGKKPSAGPQSQRPSSSRSSLPESAPPSPANRRSNDDRRINTHQTANEEAAVQDLSFWQRRIEDALAEEQLPRRPRPGSS